MKGLPPVLITAIVLVAGFALCALQFPNIASTRVVGNLLTDNAFLGIVAIGMTSSSSPAASTSRSAR